MLNFWGFTPQHLRKLCHLASVSGVCPSPICFGMMGLDIKIVTWLILPVVICLSQRLSHACLSISNLYRETANGSLNQLSFI